MFWPNDKTQQDHSTEEAHDVSIHQAAANDDLAKSLHTALHWAILNNSSTMVQLLLSRGADASMRDNGTVDDSDGFTPVESAARLNAIAAMKEFIVHGVDPESSSAVYLAARENHMDMLRLLFDKT
ncbi:hypothetical protein BKA66DRAFT_433410, partial [Pyrenochaeta sp. MPI-SDFR-AT-0127]